MGYENKTSDLETMNGARIKPNEVYYVVIIATN